MRISDWSSDVCSSDLLDVTPQMPFEIPGGGSVGMINLSDMMGKAFGGGQKKRRKLTVASAWEKLVEEEADARLDQDEVSRVALSDAEENGIVFLDEIDKIAVSDEIGRASCRERVCQYVWISVVAVSLKKKNILKKHKNNDTN